MDMIEQQKEQNTNAISKSYSECINVEEKAPMAAVNSAMREVTCVRKGSALSKLFVALRPIWEATTCK